MTDTIAEVLPAIERKLELAAGPERVWRALTDPAELSAWFPQRADFEPIAGYEGWMEWDEHGRYLVRVEEVDAPRRIAFRWESSAGAGVDAPGSTLVEWTLAAGRDGGTVLRLRESGFVRLDQRAGNEEGWTEELAELVALVERH